MGTKKPSYTFTDTLSMANSGDPKLQSGGKISQNPTSRSKPAVTLDRDNKGEEYWMRKMESEKMRDKARYKEIETLERAYRERNLGFTPQFREREREWRERESRQEDGRGKNGRLLPNTERDIDREVKGGKSKGDTFLRIRKDKRNYTPDVVAEERDRSKRDQPRGEKKDDWERDKLRYRDRERDEVWNRAKDPRERSENNERSQQRERYKVSGVDFQDRTRETVESRGMKEGDGTRKMGKPRSDKEERKHSPNRKADRDIYTMKREQRGEGRRDIRSEGDGNERGHKREKRGDREVEEHQLSRSMEDHKGKTDWERDRDRGRYRERDSRSEEDIRGKTDWDRDRDKERYRERDKEIDGPRRKERGDNREKYRENEKRAAKQAEREVGSKREEINQSRPERLDRERKERREYGTGRCNGSQSDSASTVPLKARSSGEWSSDMDSGTRNGRDRDNYDRRDRRREETHTHKRGKDKQKDPERRGKQQILAEKRDDRDEMTGNQERGKWFEPQRRKNSPDEYLEKERHTKQKAGRSERNTDSKAERGRDGQQIEEGLNERNLEHRVSIEYTRDPEGVSVDGEDEIWRETSKKGKEHLSDSDGGIEGSRPRDADRNNTGESDRKEQDRNFYLATGEEGSEEIRKLDKERGLLVEDGFVTLSSGEDKKVYDEEEFTDSQEFMEVGVTYEDLAPGFQGREEDERKEEDWTMGKEKSVDEEDQGKGKTSKYVFCVIGQTFSRSETSEMSSSQDERGGAERESPNSGSHYDSSDDSTLKSQNDQNSNEDNHTQRWERPASGDTHEGNVRYRASSKVEDAELLGKMKSKVKPLCTDSRTFKRDSKTDRLLKKWREQNKELSGKELDQASDVCSLDRMEPVHPVLDEMDMEAMSPEELEAFRIRMSGAWTISEPPKRHSQAPHLKWANNVVCEILGQSVEQAVDEPNAEEQESQGMAQSESNKRHEVATEWTMDVPVVSLTKDGESETQLEDEDLLEKFRGRSQSQGSMQVKAMHVTTPTYTHADILINTGEMENNRMDQNTETFAQTRLKKSKKPIIKETENEAEVCLNVPNNLYKPNSCPILNYDFESHFVSLSSEGKGQEMKDEMCQSEDERQLGEPEDVGTSVEMGNIGIGETVDIVAGEVAKKKIKANLTNSCSFRDLGSQARVRRRGIRKTTERRNGGPVGRHEEESVGRDRRPIISSTTDDEDFLSKSWSEAELRTPENQQTNSKFFSETQLYQVYSEAAQNFEILRQSRSDVLSVCEESTSPQSPGVSPTPARRPLPPLPSVLHPHSLTHSGSITSIRNLTLPAQPRNERRCSSPRLSISLSQSSSLWRELPGVRDSMELENLSEAQRRLQEVKFEVVTSEASYCRSLDIAVDHFVKSKELEALLSTKDKNWLFSRLTDVRTASRSFFTKLEERVELDVLNFTVCDIIVQLCPRFRKVYVPYLTNQSYQDSTYQRLMNDNPGFKQIVENLEKSPVCQRLPFRSFLVLPFQRITRLKLLVQNIVKRTTPDTPEWTHGIKALKLLEELIQESNDSISQMKSIESLVTLSGKVEFECRTLPLISQFRRLVREGLVTELMDFSQKENERKIYLHLFNDNLLVSQPKESGRFTVIDHCPVSDLRAENFRIKLLSLERNLFRLHMPQKALLLRAESQSDKLRWISALSRPHPKIDYSAAQELEQMQCIRAFVAQQPDEMSLEKADVILVHSDSAECDDWVEGTKLSDRHRGWVPRSHLEFITNAKVKEHNLSDALKLTNAKDAV